jgi:hypothetical protein
MQKDIPNYGGHEKLYGSREELFKRDGAVKYE